MQNNFDGRKFWVRAQDGTRLDSMFFPQSDEKVKTVEEMKEAGEEFTPPEYLEYPTVIFFMQNA